MKKPKKTVIPIDMIFASCFMVMGLMIFLIISEDQKMHADETETETESESVVIIYPDAEEVMMSESFLLESETEKQTETESESETETEAMTETEAESDVQESEMEAMFRGYDFIPLPSDFQVQVKALADSYGVNFELVLAVMMSESSFDMDAVGDNGAAIGLMQIQPRWWQPANEHEKSLDVNKPLDNAEIGIILLSRYLVQNQGNYEKALKRYNSGNPNSTRNDYFQSVQDNYAWICRMEMEGGQG